ncbi:glycoside hydrolase family 61 protein, partial [Rhizodiscina lignyota]
MSATLRAAGLASALIAAVNAHGYVQGGFLKGVWWEGYSPSFQYASPPPVVPGWSDPENLANGYIPPDQYATTNITCHEDATPGQTHLNMTAGETITLSWTTWPSSHVGPMLTYLANCNGPCETVDKADLKFFKIDELGLIDPTGTPKWASDLMIAQNNSWDVTIPTGIASGNYVMRHETIALHSAGTADGAQNYPYCINIAVTGDGTAAPPSEAATSFYKEDDPGILINVYQSLTTYDIPGPTLWSGA